MRRLFPSVLLLLVLSPLAVRGGDGDPESKTNARAADPEVVPDSPPEEEESDPVGVFTGSVYESAEDLRVACPGIDLVVFRHYSSADMRTGPLGYGWTHAYDWSVVRDGDRVEVRASGERGPSDCVHAFAPVPPPGGEAWNADGYCLRRSASGLWSVATPEAVLYSFDQLGLLSSVRAWSGERVDVVRDGSGRVIRAEHSCGKSLSFEYGPDGLLLRVSTPDPAVFAEYSHSVHGQWPVLSSVVRRDGPRVSSNLYSYSSSPRAGTRALPPPGAAPVPQRASPGWKARRPVMTGKADANGVEGSFEYIRPTDSAHVRCARTSLSGGLFATAFAFSGASTAVESPFAGGVSRTVYRRDAKWREVSRATGGETLAKTYDEAGDLVSETLSSSATGFRVESRASYDSRHRVVSAGIGFNAVPRRFASISWDDVLNVPNRVVSPEGRVSEWRWTRDGIDVFGAGRGDPRGVARISLGPGMRPLSVVFPGGGRADFAYDASGYVTNVASSCLPPVSMSRDSLGNVSSASLPGPGGTVRTVSAQNNWRGRPLSVLNFDGTSETFEYEGNGRRVTRHVDALGREDVYRWVLGLPVHAGRVAGGATNSLFGAEHDEQLNVVAITDPLGRRAETYVLDANERVVAVTNVEGQAMSREYLVGGFVASETRFDGTSVAYGYDADGNLASAAYPGEALSFSYDGDGLMLSASSPAGVVSNEYDAATGWLMASVGADGTCVSFARGDDGAVTSATSVAGTTHYALDAAQRRTRVDSPAGTLSIGYCGWNGLVSSTTNGHGFVVEYAYDVMDRVTNISWRTAGGASLGGFAYGYDAVGRITSRSHAIGANAFDRVYSYDALDRLASDGGVSYTYDAAGNRMTRTEDGATVTYILGVGDRLASWTGGAYTHDAAGCVTRIERDGRPTLDLAWNSQYQLVSVSTNGAFAESYAYDALGRRVSTTTVEGTTRGGMVMRPACLMAIIVPW